MCITRHLISSWQLVPLGAEHFIAFWRLPLELDPPDRDFDVLWDLRPAEPPSIQVHGRIVKLSRWQQAYGRDYHFSGSTSVALGVPTELEPYLRWAQRDINNRLNGLLLNWYDGRLGHYIGKHRDSIVGLVESAPIVAISLGETRLMRFRRWKGTERLDVPLHHCSVVIIPYDTNRAWTHEIVKSKRAHTRRISITIRAFA